jgi:hypothetical protein
MHSHHQDDETQPYALLQFASRLSPPILSGHVVDVCDRPQVSSESCRTADSATFPVYAADEPRLSFLFDSVDRSLFSVLCVAKIRTNTIPGTHNFHCGKLGACLF